MKPIEIISKSPLNESTIYNTIYNKMNNKIYIETTYATLKIELYFLLKLETISFIQNWLYRKCKQYETNKH